MEKVYLLALADNRFPDEFQDGNLKDLKTYAMLSTTQICNEKPEIIYCNSRRINQNSPQELKGKYKGLLITSIVPFSLSYGAVLNGESVQVTSPS